MTEVNTPPISIIPGTHLFENLAEAWQRAAMGPKLFNSLFMSIMVAAGKIAFSSVTAFGIVYFRFPGRMIAFWMIFITLMLPLEVRIVPTYAVAANALSPFQHLIASLGIVDLVAWVSGWQIDMQWNLLNSRTGLVLPLVATATGTFLYRQFFLTVPAELFEASRMDGAGPLRFFWQILMPLSRTNMIALFTIMFLYAWNQYLWPLLITTDRANFGTAVMALRLLLPAIGDSTGGAVPDWNVAMAGCLIVILPPMLVVATLQRFVIRGLVSADK